MKPVHFKIIPLKEELVSHSGLALAGDLLASTEISKRADGLVLPAANPPKHRSKPVKSHSDCLLSMIGLLCLGKTDFADIVQFREDPFFKKSLGLRDVPSEPTFRQRMVKFGGLPQQMLREEAARMVRRFAPEITACFKDWICAGCRCLALRQQQHQERRCQLHLQAT